MNKKEIEIQYVEKPLIESYSVKKIERILNDLYIKIENMKFVHSIEELVSLIYFFAETYEYIIDKDKWNKIIMEYIKAINSLMFQNNRPIRLSLFGGITEVGLGVSLLNKATGHYSKFLDDINKFILLNVSSTIKMVNDNINDLKVQHYDVITGISGITRYLININSINDTSAIHSCLSYLVEICGKKRINGHILPRWYIKSENQNRLKDRIKFSKGNFNLGFAHGIAGVLAVLSYAASEGISVSKQKESIIEIISEYKRTAMYDDGIVYWQGQCSYDDFISEKKDINKCMKRMSWCYGSIGILRAIKKGAEVIDDQELLKWVRNSICDISKIDIERYRVISPILCHGYAGILILLINEFREKESIDIKRRIRELTEIILKLYSSSHEYGFYILDEKWIDGKCKAVQIFNNSLLEGTIGITLALISLLKKTNWEKHLLVQ